MILHVAKFEYLYSTFYIRFCFFVFVLHYIPFIHDFISALFSWNCETDVCGKSLTMVDHGNSFTMLPCLRVILCACALAVVHDGGLSIVVMRRLKSVLICSVSLHLCNQFEVSVLHGCTLMRYNSKNTAYLDMMTLRARCVGKNKYTCRRVFWLTLSHQRRTTAW